MYTAQHCVSTPPRLHPRSRARLHGRAGAEPTRARPASRQGDLALDPSKSDSAAAAAAAAVAAASASSSNLLMDESAAALDLLLRPRPGSGRADEEGDAGDVTVDIVLDNCGIEFLCDLVTRGPRLVRAVRVHPLPTPTSLNLLPTPPPSLAPSLSERPHTLTLNTGPHSRTMSHSPLLPPLRQVLADALLTHGGVGRVRLHAKKEPLFVSDALPVDAAAALAALAAHPDPAAQELGRRAADWALAGRLEICRCGPGRAGPGVVGPAPPTCP
jgi:hypothetical protein